MSRRRKSSGSNPNSASVPALAPPLPSQSSSTMAPTTSTSTAANQLPYQPSPQRQTTMSPPPIQQQQQQQPSQSQHSNKSSNSHQQHRIHATRHPEYYFDDGNLILLVETTLFNVHRGVLQRHSEIFCSLLSLPQPSGSLEGSRDSVPVRLDDVKSNDFEKLLWILYPPVMGELKPRDLGDWLAILDLSSKWVFDGIKMLATREIEKLSLTPLERITISRRYDIKPEWLLPAYVALCERTEPLSYAEASAIDDLDVIIKLAHARELIQRSMWDEGWSSRTSIWVPPRSSRSRHVNLLPGGAALAGPMNGAGAGAGGAGVGADDLFNEIFGRGGEEAMSPAERVKNQHLAIVTKVFKM